MTALLIKELRLYLRNGRAFWIAAAYALGLGVVALTEWPDAEQSRWGAQIGKDIFDKFVTAQWLLALLLAPAFTWSSVSGEREQRTWESLRCAPVRPWHIASGKVASAAIYVALLTLATVPITCLSFFLGGVSLSSMIRAYQDTTFMGLASASLGLFWSSLAGATYLSVVLTYGTIALLYQQVFRFGGVEGYLGVALLALTAATAMISLPIEVVSSMGLSGKGKWRNFKLLSRRSRVNLEWLVDRAPVAVAELRRRLGSVVMTCFILLMAFCVSLTIALALAGFHWHQLKETSFWARNFTWVQFLVLLTVTVVPASLSFVSERRTATLSLLLTSPVSATAAVAGKLVGSLGLGVMWLIASMPVLVLGISWTGGAPAQALHVLFVDLVYAAAFACLALCLSLRIRRPVRALSATVLIASGVVIGTLVSFQTISLSPSFSWVTHTFGPSDNDVHEINITRAGQLLTSAVPLATLNHLTDCPMIARDAFEDSIDRYVWPRDLPLISIPLVSAAIYGLVGLAFFSWTTRRFRTWGAG